MYPIFMPMPMYSYGEHFGNVPQHFKNKYGHGHIDFAEHPKAISYPIHTIEAPVNYRKKDGLLSRLFKKSYYDNYR